MSYAEVMARNAKDPHREFVVTAPDGSIHIRRRNYWVRAPKEVADGYRAAAERHRAFCERYGVSLGALVVTPAKRLTIRQRLRRAWATWKQTTAPCTQGE